MKIVFIVPTADIRRNSIYRFGSKIYGHTNSIVGPLILGRILEDAGHTVEAYEELYEDLDFKKFEDADFIMLYTMTSNSTRAYHIADYFRNEKHKRVVIGGIHASSMPEEALQHADQVIVGEGESVIRDVVEGRIKDKIVYAKCIKNIDEIPFPDYNILKTPCDAANVITSRGCPFECSFCTTSRMFHPYRKRTPDNVIEELKTYKEQGFKYMNFEDDNFTADKARAKGILRKMISNKLVFRETFFFGRTDMANDEELLQLLHDAHLNRVLIGVESLNQKSLDDINKKQKISDIEKCGKVLKKYKIKIIASLVLGLDSDSKEDMERGEQFCKKIKAYQFQPAILTPFPKTPVYEQYEKENRMLKNDWQYFDMMVVNFKPKNMSPYDLQSEFFKLIKKFYTFKSSFAMFKIFGPAAGFRRLGLWIAVKFVNIFFKRKSNMNDGNIYNKLKEVSNS
ncbi:radical SAM protein [Clostridium sp. JN-1]|uniref:B12-binding domain-containing radical SAM protein n=1 Tax=Clostridium sp. JN-1 TaxID=2483110 RepID=UPI000F0B5A69|nr:radical SAM protein [Clostridium sp. JN-1]